MVKKKKSVYLKKPNKERNRDDGENCRLQYGVASTRGWKKEMEDCHIANPDLDSDTSFFGIYDGHGGNDVSMFCKKILHERFTINERKLGHIEDAIKQCYEKVLELDGQDSGEEYPYNVRTEAGCSACVVIIKHGNIVVANAGDSRCIIFSQDEWVTRQRFLNNAQGLIKQAVLLQNGYVNGVLNITRAIGDLELKDKEKLPRDQVIMPTPDVKTLKAKEAYIVLACDGIWDLMTSSEVINFIKEHKDTEPDLSGICEKLIDNCVAAEINSAGIGCDNMSVILIELKNPLHQEMKVDAVTNIHAAMVPSMNSLVDFYTSRCSMLITSEIVGKLESKYLFAEEMCPDDVQAKIDSVMGSKSDHYEFNIPTKSNSLFKFDEDLLQVCRLRSKSYKCSGAVAEVIAKVLKIVKKNLDSGKRISTRGLYYQDVTHFRKQRAVDDAIILISLMLEVTRSSLNIYASSRGLIKGPITLEGPQFEVDCDNGGIMGNIVPVEAFMISSVTVKPNIAKINFILVVEKEAVFMELCGLGIPRKLGCIMITSRGEPDMSTRALLCRLQKFLPDVPLYALVDPNPYGIGIFCTYKFGSKRMAHDNLGYSVPNLQWIGLYPSQLQSVMGEGPIIKATQDDIKKAQGLLQKDQISNDTLLKGELTWIMIHKLKGDIECCAHLGSDFMRDYVASAIAGLMDDTKEPKELIRCFKQVTET